MRYALRALVCTCALLTISGCRPPGADATEELAGGAKDGAAAAADSETVLVRLGTFQLGEIDTRLTVAADLEAVSRAAVYPEVTGVVREVLRREGDLVAQGDKIIQLVDEVRRLTLENKELLVAQGRTKEALAGVALAEAETAVRQKEIALEQADSEWARVRDRGGRVVTPEEADQKRYAAEQARSDLAAARLAVDRRRLEKEQSAQEIRVAEKDVESARLELDRTVLRSPIDGSISQLDLRPGETVTPSAVGFQVVDGRRLEARVHVPQRELRRLAVGQRVEIRCEVYPDVETPFAGRVAVINPVVEKETGTVRVIVDVEDPSGRLKPGMFIDAEIVTDVRRAALLVSKKAILHEAREPILYLVEEGIARRYAVRPGLANRDWVEVLALEARPRGWTRGDPAVELDLTRRVETPDAATVAADAEGPGVVRVELARGQLVLVGQNNLEDGKRVRFEASESTVPATTEPATTEPATTEPATTEPATTDPASTVRATRREPDTDRDASVENSSAAEKSLPVDAAESVSPAETGGET